MDIDIRRILEEEIDEYFTVPNFGWGRPDPSEEDLQWLRRPLEIDRTLAAFENGRIVATVGTNSLRMRVPGNVLGVGGIYPGIVTKQTHRRRGLMSRMLADPRMLRRSPSDATWLKLVDVRKALDERVYFAEGEVRFEVVDTICPWNQGAWRVSGGPDGTHCTVDSGPPEIVLSAADLAAIYLGSTSFKVLAQAGRVEERTPGALHRADLMFLSGVKPWGPFH